MTKVKMILRHILPTFTKVVVKHLKDNSLVDCDALP